MLAKRRLFGALLFMLTLLSSAACAKLNLKPYEVPSAPGTEVEILAPEVYLLLHDSPLNGGKLKTAPAGSYSRQRKPQLSALCCECKPIRHFNHRKPFQFHPFSAFGRRRTL